MVASAGRGTRRVPALTKYDVLEELGHGGMATVYRAHDKRLARDVAVKVLHPHLKESHEIAHRFAAEAKAVAKLRHPNIVEVFDVSDEDEQEQYLVVEFVRGETLRKLLARRGALPPEIAAALALELLSALAHAHEGGVVHRDVKPENVLLEHRKAGSPTSQRDTSTPIPTSPPVASSRRSPDDVDRADRVIVKLTDFGIAKLLDAQGVTSTGQVLGSPAHMAPEQIEGGEVDGRADVFGMGVLLYECMVGHLPFEGNNPAQVLRRVLDGSYPSAERERPNVGRVWSEILDRSLARAAEDRFPDADGLREAIKAELDRLGVADPRTELSAWFDDPKAWEAAHEKRLIPKLCELGARESRQGFAVAAAGDYNRALAYAPDDPQLLRIVARMQQAEARRRLVRRVAPLVLATIGLGTSAYFVARRFRVDPVAAHPQASAEPSAQGSGSAGPIADVVPSVGVSAKPTAEKLTPVVTTIGHVRDSGPKESKRILSLGSVQPAFGVMLSLDGAAPVEVSANYAFETDGKGHTLVFTCKGDLCEPKTLQVAAGESAESLGLIQLVVRPGRILVEGEPAHSYGVDEIPGMTLTPGVPADIPMTEGKRLLNVYDRADVTIRKSVTVLANRQAVVSLKK